jgi:hypothetical protein
MYVAVWLYAVSMILPSFRVFDGFSAGFEVALTAEIVTMNFARNVAARFASGGPVPGVLFSSVGTESLWGDIAILAGAAANHLFVLALAAAWFRWRKTAVASARLAALAAVGCMLPAQILDSRWYLGPGYFVWCAAFIVLAVAVSRRPATSPDNSVVPPCR